MGSRSYNSVQTEFVLRFINELPDLSQFFGKLILATAPGKNLSLISALSQGATRLTGVRRILIAASQLRVTNEK